MRIKRIHFYRYGMFSDATFDLPARGLQVIYGVNEAGKSTMMRFIREMLFGFSSQSPGISDDGSTYGGRMALEFPKQGTVVIERTGNKGRGTAKVYFANGEEAGEDALNELFPGLNSPMFRAIFCFGLDGLAGLENIKAEEMNDYLFHAGMTGNFSIAALEKKLAKKQDELFKPAGRKPQLNRDLAELERMEKEVGEWQRKNAGYHELAERSNGIRKRLKEIGDEQEAYKGNIRALEKQKLLAPYVKERHEAEWRLQHLPSYEPFPEDGLSRFDHWRTQAVALEAELAELEEKRNGAVGKSDDIQVNAEWLQLKSEVQRERELERFMQGRENERAAQEQAVEAEEEELAVLLEKLGPNWSEEQINAADAGFIAKEALKKEIRERTELQQRMDVLNSERMRMERLLQENEKELHGVTAKRLSAEEQREIQEKLEMYEELLKKREMKSELETRMDQGGAPPFRNFVFYGGSALGAVLVIWMIVKGQWWTSAATAVLTAAFAVYLSRSGEASEGEKLKRDLISLTKQISRLPNISKEEVEEAESDLKEDDRLRQSEAVLKDRFIQRESAYRDAVEQTEAVRQKLKKADGQIGNWCGNHRFPRETLPEQLLEIFERVEDAKTRMRRRNRGKSVCETIDKERTEREGRLTELCKAFGIPFENGGLAVVKMVERIGNEENQLREKQRLTETVREYEEQIRSMREKANRYHNECDGLMKRAQVHSEEAYRSKGKAWVESREILETLASIDAKLETLVKEETERKAAIAAVLQQETDVEDEIQRVESESTVLEKEARDLYEQTAAVNEQKKRLEEGGSYAELLHQFEHKKDEFRGEARNWAVYRTAEHLLKRAKKTYRSQRMPAVISKASEVFMLLTDGRYSAVFAPENEGFIVQRTDGARFSPQQLSRGTGEQLYLALRLALAQIYQSPSPYPFIMDDILVNFDATRVEQAVKVCREAAQDRQVLLFTCHDYLLGYFNKDETLYVKGNQVLI